MDTEIHQASALPRTLATNPEILLMDEPLGALDAILREKIQCDFYRIHKEHKKTTIFVTHDLHEALLLADRIVLFSVSPTRVLADIVMPMSGNHIPMLEKIDLPDYIEIKDKLLELMRINAARLL
ncbi:hypothetical protein [Acidihalobacter ferrooxydans]|uniref:hypothetical protein n=1 Tax=Acidihalobacter ferrooxydans TaxID=1765967 RepID=UPI001E3715C0|nr:hypothetical protein [Acidihalobacter ferrooxydans]